MDTKSEQTGRRPALWANIVRLCKDLQAVIAILALVLAALPYVANRLRVLVRPEVRWGELSDTKKLDETFSAHESGLATAWVQSDGPLVHIFGIVTSGNEEKQVAASSVSADGSRCSIAFAVDKGERWRAKVVTKEAYPRTVASIGDL